MQRDPLLWDDEPTRRVDGERGVYIAVSGNTGAGKSSLIKAVVDLGAERDVAILGVSERTFHHPLLRLMFARPGDYAFGVQLNFMLQRHMFLRRQLELGNTILIERSHFDDEMFAWEHAQAGHISPAQWAAYRQLAAVLHRELPAPDAFVLLEVPVEESVRRVGESEDSGARPREFPDEESKRRWVSRWYDLYRSFHTELRSRKEREPAFARTVLFDRDATAPTRVLAEEVLAMITRLRR